MSRIAILGGGITGTVLARALACGSDEIVLFESSDTLGGLVTSFEVGGTPLECYYHHVFTHETHIRRLIDDLGLTDRLSWLPSSVGILHEGRVWPFTNPTDLLRFRPIPMRDRLRVGAASMLSPWLSDWRHLDGTTAVDWLRRTMGRRATETIWEPMLRVKFGEAYPEVPAAWMWARLSQRARSRDGKDLGESLGYLRGGFRQIFDRLESRLVADGVKLRLATPVRRVVVERDRVVGLETAEGPEELDAVVSTVPVPVLTGMCDALPEALAGRLDAVRYMGVVCVVITLDRQVSPVYWLNIAERDIPFGAYIEHTNLVPAGEYAGNHVAYLGRYFPPGAPQMDADLETIADHWVSNLDRINPGFRADWVTSVTPFRTRFAAPLVHTGYGRTRLPYATPVTGLWLATMAQIYPQDRGMSEGVKLALEAADAIRRRRMIERKDGV